MFTVSLVPPYDFTLTATCARFYSVFGRLMPDGAYRRLARDGDSLALIELRGVGSLTAPQVSAHVLAERGSPDPARLERSVRRWLNADRDLRPFHSMAADDAGMSATLDQLHGLSSFQLDSMLESLFVTIIEQQIALRMAQSAERWLIATYGESLTYEGETYHTFPSAHRLAALTVDDLKPLKITGIRSGRLIDIARQVADGALDLETLRDHPVESAYAALTAIKGVGHWTAAWTIMRALGVPINVGGADVALRAAVNRYVYGQPGRCDPQVMDAYLRSYAPYDGWAAFVLLTRYALEKYLPKTHGRLSLVDDWPETLR